MRLRHDILPLASDCSFKGIYAVVDFPFLNKNKSYLDEMM